MQASSEDRTRDLALTKRMLCQLSYRGEGTAPGGASRPEPGGKGDFFEARCRDSEIPESRNLDSPQRKDGNMFAQEVRGIGAIGSVRP